MRVRIAAPTGVDETGVIFDCRARKANPTELEGSIAHAHDQVPREAVRRSGSDKQALCVNSMIRAEEECPNSVIASI
jgi:hypothetical protein